MAEEKKAAPAKKAKSTVAVKAAPKSSARAKKEAVPAKVKAVERIGNKVVLNGYFRAEYGTYRILRRNIQKGCNTLLIGPTGTGKTELVDNLAKALGTKVTVFDMGTMSDPIMGLVGTHVITVKEGKTTSEFKKSRFSDVIQEEGIVLLDEISRASAAANNLLFPVLDFRRELSMEYSFEDNTPIKIHPKCVFFATANMGSQYTGTHKLDRALIDRFMTVEVDQMGTSDTKDALKAAYPNIAKGTLDKIVDIYVKINKEHADFKIGFNLSMRHLKTIAALVGDRFTIYDAYYTLIKGLGGKEGLKAIESILKAGK